MGQFPLGLGAVRREFSNFQHQFYSRPEGRALTLVGTLNPTEINDRIDPNRYDDGVNAEQAPDVVAALRDRFLNFEAGPDA